MKRFRELFYRLHPYLPSSIAGTLAVLGLLAFALVPITPQIGVGDFNLGVLFFLAIVGLSAYAVMLAGWSSSNKFSMLGALRAGSQMISYELAMGFALVCVLMAAQSLNLGAIVRAQEGGWGLFNWFWIPLAPIFLVYLIAGVAETNRAPFDVAEGESEIVAGFHVEYGGMAFSIFFMAEYANMILVSTLCVLLFLGGWLSPFAWLDFIPGWIWLGIKVFVVVTILIPMF